MLQKELWEAGHRRGETGEGGASTVSMLRHVLPNGNLAATATARTSCHILAGRKGQYAKTDDENVMHSQNKK
jgi:hypothetical protein